MPGHQSLITQLNQLDGRGYKAYSSLRGSHSFPDFTLFVDHVQGDPFAAPSRIRLRVPHELANLPQALASNATRRVALADWLARRVHKVIGAKDAPTRAETSDATPHRHKSSRGRASGKSGSISIDAGGQEVLERTAVKITPEWVEARMEIGLPAAGRRILADQAIDLLTRRLPHIVKVGILWIPPMRKKPRPLSNASKIRNRSEVNSSQKAWSPSCPMKPDFLDELGPVTRPCLKSRSYLSVRPTP